jgi:DNA-binding NarL/FixJ family response regulator
MVNRHRARVLIADDHKLVAEACKSLLEPEFDVVGTVFDGYALLKAVTELRPDVVILDISMPLLNGLDAGEQIKQKNRATKIIYLTMMVGPEIAAEAFRRGASGFVLKHSNAEELVFAVRRVLLCESYLSSTISRDAVQFLLQSGAVYKGERSISRRQSDVLQLLVKGKSMREIASVLQLKHGTVAYHKYRMMETLGVKTSAGLIEYAIKHHLISEKPISLTSSHS